MIPTSSRASGWRWMMSFGVLHVAGYHFGGWMGVCAVTAGVSFLLVNLHDLHESLRRKPE